MWESAKTVAPTPNSAIVQPNVDDNFVINSTHLNMIRENKFNGHLRADPHDHIREFLAICNMFRYGETQSEAVKLLIFPFSLCDKAKTWVINAMDSQIISLNEELQDMREKYNELRNGNASKNHLNDDTPMCERREANYIQSEDYQNRNSYDSFSHQSLHDPNDSEKSLTELNIDVRNDLEDFKRHRTEPPPPPQAQTEHVNAVFTGSGMSDDSLKIQKDPPPPIIVNNKIKKDKPIKTSKKGYHVVKTEEYPFREYIPKIPYPQRLNVDHSHLNRIVKVS
ncbi:hypothetical protein Tco_0634052 [Tanacetum coccineum]